MIISMLFLYFLVFWIVNFLFFSYRLEKDRWNTFEAEVMSDVSGWEVGKSVYNSERWVPERAGSKYRTFT